MKMYFAGNPGAGAPARERERRTGKKEYRDGLYPTTGLCRVIMRGVCN